MSRNFDLLRDYGSEEHFVPRNSSALPGEISSPTVGSWNNVSISSGRFDFSGSLQVLRKHWRAAGLVAFLIFAAVLSGTLLMKPVYEPMASLEIDPVGSETFSLD